MESFLSIRGLTKKYQNTVALDGISFDVPAGTVFGLLGPNGAGKTTFIRIVNRIINYDSGEIFFDGKPLSREHINRIGYLPEERGLYRKMKVGEQIEYFARLKGLSASEARNKMRYWFDRLDIRGWEQKKVQELSKGMQQKIQFIITVIHDPDLLIFDEPFSGFDPVNQEMLKSEIQELNRRGKTILFSTHMMASVEELCDSIVLINKGKIMLEGMISNIKDEFKQNDYLIQFAGLSGELKSNEDFEVVEKIDGNTFKVRIVGDKETNDLLVYATSFGKVIRFEEILPSLNEIFINVVQHSKVMNHEHE